MVESNSGCCSYGCCNSGCCNSGCCDSGCCNTVGAPTPCAALPKAQSFDFAMMESTAAYTGCSQNEAFASLMQCDNDICRASELARRCVSSGHVAALGEVALVTLYIGVETESGSKASLLPDAGNSTRFVVTKAFWLLHFPHLRLERPASKLVGTAGASPLFVFSEIEFEAFVLIGKRGRARFRAQVVQTLPGVGSCMSMREIKAMGTDILTSKKQIELPAFSPPIMLPLYKTRNQRLPPPAGITAPASVACISAAAEGTRLLEPH